MQNRYFPAASICHRQHHARERRIHSIWKLIVWFIRSSKDNQGCFSLWHSLSQCECGFRILLVVQLKYPLHFFCIFQNFSVYMKLFVSFCLWSLLLLFWYLVLYISISGCNASRLSASKTVSCAYRTLFLPFITSTPFSMPSIASLKRCVRIFAE